jgi:flagellar basal-body rod protein FlgF
MSTGVWSAASGAVAQGNALDVAANNIANATTPGFRADRAVFRQEFARALARGEAPGSMRYAVVRSTEPDLRAGSVVSTGRALDVSIRDPNALFVVSTPQGERYTRAGSLQISPDGRVTTRDGQTYLGPDRRPLRVQPGAESVSVEPDGGLVVDGEPSNSRLLMVSFPNPKGLEKAGEILLRARPEAGRPRAAESALETETLELSNAPALQSMTTLVSATRQFEMLTKVIEAFSTAERRAATDIMRR